MTLRRGRLEEWKSEDNNKFYFRPELANPLPVLGEEGQAYPFLNSKDNYRAPVTKFQALCYLQVI